MRSRQAFTRTNLIVDKPAVRALRRALGAPTDSEAVRIAVRDRLLVEEALSAFDRIRARGGVDDVFHRARSVRRTARRNAR